jgi:hypothetical protein
MSKLLRDRSLGIVLLVIFLVSWVLQGWTGWHEFEAQQTEHDQTATFWGQSGYIWSFLQATLENWQSEFLQLLTFVVLTSFLIWRGSPESREGQDEMMDTLKRIEARLDAAESDAPSATR